MYKPTTTRLRQRPVDRRRVSQAMPTHFRGVSREMWLDAMHGHADQRMLR